MRKDAFALVPYAVGMDDVEVRELRYFIAVAEELNFTRAAQRLGMAQPPLSAAIGKLERKLGVRLLDRTSRRVTLTPAGALLLAEGRTAVENLGAAVQRVRRQAGPEEFLTVVVKAGDGSGLVRQITGRCAADPQLPEVRIMFSRAGDLTAAVRAGVADAAILRVPFDSRGLDTEVLLTEPRVAALPAGHRLADRTDIRRADLAGEPMPRWADPAGAAALAFWTGTDAQPGPAALAPADPGNCPARPGPLVSDMNQLLDAVALGQAIAFIPASVASRHAVPDLAFVPVTDLSPSTVAAAWPADSRSPAIARFIRTAAEVAASHTSEIPKNHFERSRVFATTALRSQNAARPIPG
jgi:DNA-binding transcriptional LysR family regulator